MKVSTVDKPCSPLYNKTDVPFILCVSQREYILGSGKMLDKRIAIHVHSFNFVMLRFLEIEDYFECMYKNLKNLVIA